MPPSQERPSAAYGDASDQPMLDFLEERSSASFRCREMIHLLNGGESKTKAKERAMRQLERLPWLSAIAETWADCSRAEKREKTMEQIKAIYRLFVNDSGDMEMRNGKERVRMHSNSRKPCMHFSQLRGSASIWPGRNCACVSNLMCVSFRVTRTAF